MQQCDPPGLAAWDLFTWPDLIKKRYYEQRVSAREIEDNRI